MLINRSLDHLLVTLRIPRLPSEFFVQQGCQSFQGSRGCSPERRKKKFTKTVRTPVFG